MGRIKTATLITVLLVSLCACVAGSAEAAHSASTGPLSQFLLGFWHGLIGPFTLIVEAVNRFAPRLLPWRAHLYEATAAGVPYDVGFYVGLAGSPVVVWSRRR